MASQALQQLRWDTFSEWEHPDDVVLLDWHKVSLLKGLTKLDISDQTHADCDIECLQQSGLVELALIRCFEVEHLIFVPGALRRLESLHIRNDCSELHEPPHLRGACNAESLRPDAELRSLGDVILNLPKLGQLSGGGTLFSEGMKEGLKEWDRVLPRPSDWISWRCAQHHQNIWRRKGRNPPNRI